jgi:hypothetical protein
MNAVKSAGPVEAVVLQPEAADAPGVLRLAGAYYDYGAQAGGYWLKRLSTGAVYHVRVAGGRPVSCDCPAAKFTRHRGPCKHAHACECVLADALKERD